MPHTAAREEKTIDEPAEIVSLGAARWRSVAAHTRSARVRVALGSAAKVGERAESSGGRYHSASSSLDAGSREKASRDLMPWANSVSSAVRYASGIPTEYHLVARCFNVLHKDIYSDTKIRLK